MDSLSLIIRNLQLDWPILKSGVLLDHDTYNVVIVCDDRIRQVREANDALPHAVCTFLQRNMLGGESYHPCAVDLLKAF